MPSPFEMDYNARARFLIGLQLPSKCGYLLTDELAAEGAELLRKGQTFDIWIDEKRVGLGFEAAQGQSLGYLPGVSAEGISAVGLVRLIPKDMRDDYGD